MHIASRDIDWGQVGFVLRIASVRQTRKGRAQDRASLGFGLRQNIETLRLRLPSLSTVSTNVTQRQHFSSTPSLQPWLRFNCTDLYLMDVITLSQHGHFCRVFRCQTPTETTQPVSACPKPAQVVRKNASYDCSRYEYLRLCCCCIGDVHLPFSVQPQGNIFNRS